MFASRQQATVIAKGLKIVGSVTAEGLVEVNGQDRRRNGPHAFCHSREARVTGTVAAERVVVDWESRRSDPGRRGSFEVAGSCRRRYSPPISCY